MGQARGSYEAVATPWRAAAAQAVRRRQLRISANERKRVRGEGRKRKCVISRSAYIYRLTDEYR
jgi:hypothetical protein